MNIQKKYTSEGCIMKSKFHNFFPPIGLKKNCVAFSDLLDYEMTNEKMFVSPWDCDSVTKTKVDLFLYLNMFKSALNSVHLFIDTVHRDDFLFFSVSIFIDFIAFMRLCQFLRWITNHVQIECLWVLWGKWPILKLFY